MQAPQEVMENIITVRINLDVANQENESVTIFNLILTNIFSLVHTVLTNTHHATTNGALRHSSS